MSAPNKHLFYIFSFVILSINSFACQTEEECQPFIAQFHEASGNQERQTELAAASPQAYIYYLSQNAQQIRERIAANPRAYEAAIASNIAMANQHHEILLMYLQIQGTPFEHIDANLDRFDRATGLFIPTGSHSTPFTLEDIRRLAQSGFTRFGLGGTGALILSREDDRALVVRNGRFSVDEREGLFASSGEIVFDGGVRHSVSLTAGGRAFLSTDGVILVGENNELPGGYRLQNGRISLTHRENDRSPLFTVLASRQALATLTSFEGARITLSGDTDFFNQLGIGSQRSSISYDVLGVGILRVVARGGTIIDLNVENMINRHGRPAYRLLDLDSAAGTIRIYEGPSIEQATALIISENNGLTSQRGIPRISLRTDGGWYVSEVNSQMQLGRCNSENCFDVAGIRQISIARLLLERPSIFFSGRGDGEAVVQRLLDTNAISAADLASVIRGSYSRDAQEYALALLTRNDRVLAVSILGELAQHDDPMTRMLVTEGALRLRSDELVPILSTMIQDPDERVIKQVIRALERIGGPQTIDPLLIAVGNGDIDISSAALRALREFNDDRVTQAAISALSRPELEREAVNLLVGRQGDAVVSALTHVARTTSDPDVLSAVLSNLQGRGDISSFLIEILADTNKPVELRDAMEESLRRSVTDSATARALLEYRAARNGVSLDTQALGELIERYEWGEIGINDLYYLSRGQDLRADRDALVEEIGEYLIYLQTARRTDIEGTIYTEDFNPSTISQLSLASLNRIRTVLLHLSDLNNQQQIGNLIAQDLAEGLISLPGVNGQGVLTSFIQAAHQSEIGGLLVYGDDGRLTLRPYAPRIPPFVRPDGQGGYLENSQYGHTGPLTRDTILSVTRFHLHATRWEDSRYAGPSRPDLANARESGTNGIVITSLGNGRFNVDMYTPFGQVVDLGIYSFNHDLAEASIRRGSN